MKIKLNVSQMTKNLVNNILKKLDCSFFLKKKIGIFNFFASKNTSNKYKHLILKTK